MPAHIPDQETPAGDQQRAILPEQTHVLIITDAWHPQINGVVRTYENLSKELKGAGHRVRVIGPDLFPLRTSLPGYEEIELTLFPYRRLRRYIEGFQPDMVHIATEGPLGRAARKYCLREGLAFTTAYHTQFPAYVGRRVGKFLPFLEQVVTKLVDQNIRAFHKPAAGVFVTTPSLETELRERRYDSHFFQLVRGVPLDLFSPEPEEEFKTHKKPVALYVGRIAIEKNLEAFLEMDWPGSKILVGGGPSMKELQSRFPDAVFLGPKTGKDLASAYKSADLFAFPSKTDTFGIVIIEALACGLPVAGYNVTGPRDIITAPLLGALSDGDLGSAAQEALTYGEKDPNAAQKRHDHVKTHYSWPTVADRFIQKMWEVNENKPRPSRWRRWRKRVSLRRYRKPAQKI